MLCIDCWLFIMRSCGLKPFYIICYSCLCTYSVATVTQIWCPLFYSWRATSVKEYEYLRPTSHFLGENFKWPISRQRVIRSTSCMHGHYITLPSGTMHQCLHTWRERETFLRNGWQLATYGMKRSNIGLIDEKNNACGICVRLVTYNVLYFLLLSVQCYV